MLNNETCIRSHEFFSKHKCLQDLIAMSFSKNARCNEAQDKLVFILRIKL